MASKFIRRFVTVLFIAVLVWAGLSIYEMGIEGFFKNVGKAIIAFFKGLFGAIFS